MYRWNQRIYYIKIECCKIEERMMTMHSYIRAIGFSEYTTKQAMAQLLALAEKPDFHINLEKQDGEMIVELRKMIAKNMGIAWNGTSSGPNMLDVDYYYPYVYGQYNNIHEDVTVEKRYSQNAFLGACEDMRVGVSIIFSVQNPMDILPFYLAGKKLPRFTSVIFSAMSVEGTVLLPIKMSPGDDIRKKQALKRRSNLISAARKGDESAMEALTFEDMDTYAKISKRIVTEDVFTIVESSFMPYGLESDMYSIVADIVNVEKVENTVTGEHVHILTLNYNELMITLAINEFDLQGEPLVGRRFKGNIMLQGRIILPSNVSGNSGEQKTAK